MVETRRRLAAAARAFDEHRSHSFDQLSEDVVNGPLLIHFVHLLEAAALLRLLRPC